MFDKGLTKNYELEQLPKVSEIITKKLELAQTVAKDAGNSAGLRLTEIVLKNVDISNGIEELTRFDIDLRYEVW